MYNYPYPTPLPPQSPSTSSSLDHPPVQHPPADLYYHDYQHQHYSHPQVRYPDGVVWLADDGTGEVGRPTASRQLQPGYLSHGRDYQPQYPQQPLDLYRPPSHSHPAYPPNPPSLASTSSVYPGPAPDYDPYGPTLPNHTLSVPPAPPQPLLRATDFLSSSSLTADPTPSHSLTHSSSTLSLKRRRTSVAHLPLGPSSASSVGSWTPQGGFATLQGEPGEAGRGVKMEEGGGEDVGEDREDQSIVVGERLAEKSCKNCRARKVRCSRIWPRCDRCKAKQLECAYGSLIPIDLVKGLSTAAGGGERLAELEGRIKTLELELATAHSALASTATSTSTDSTLPSSPSSSRPSLSNPPNPSLARQITDALLAPLLPFLSPAQKYAHVVFVLSSVVRRADSAAKTNPGLYGPPTAETAGGGASYPTPASLDEEGSGGGAASESESGGMKGLWKRWGETVMRDVEEARWMEGLLSQLNGSTEAQGVLVQELMGGEKWARWVVWAAMDDFWSVCSSNVPVFRHHHSPARKLALYLSLLTPSPSSSSIVSVSAPAAVLIPSFITLGLRGSSNLNLYCLSSAFPSFDSSATPAPSSTAPSLAIQRELLSRSLRALMLRLYDEGEVAHGEGTKEALEASLVAGQTMIWNEIIPRRSRSLVRVSVGMYKDVLDAARTAEEKKEVIMMYGLPLLVQDSSVAAFLRSTPLITPSDLSTYFSAFPLPSFSPPTAFSSASSSPSAPPTLVEDVAQFVDLDRLEGADHMQLLMGSMMCWKWLAGCLRCIADVSSPAASSLPLPNYTLTSLLTTLDALHAALQTFQHHLSSLPHPWAHPSCLAPGPEGDTCESVHLRWVTRVDREVDEARWLVFATAGEGLLREERRRVRVGAGARGEVELQGEGGLDGEGRIDVEWLRMCEGKVRKGLKLAAFYFNFFTLSPDPHQTHHLAWSLELCPSWTFLATQRNLGGNSGEGELTETELDWIEKGLEEAGKYHPVAERRLVEVRAYREGERRRVEENQEDEFEGEGGFSHRSPPLPLDYLPLPASSASRSALKKDAQPLSFQQAMQVALKMTVPSWR